MTDMAAEFPVPYRCSADSDIMTPTDTTAGAAGICLDLGRCSAKSDNITQHRYGTTAVFADNCPALYHCSTEADRMAYHQHDNSVC